MQKGLLSKIGTILGYLILYQVAMVPLLLGQIAPNVFIYAIFAILGLVASYYLVRRLWHFLNDNFVFDINPTRHPVIELILFVIALVAISYLTDYIPESNNQKLITEALKANTFNTVLTTVILSPIFEELIFRGLFAKLFFPTVKSAKSILCYVTITSVVFALMHEQSFNLELVPYLLMGIVLSLAYVRFGDIRYNMFLHFLNNFIAVISVVLPLIY
ncbi:CPBP family intramembrane glutamic endopeptidase [Companilactobacillus jidongensis]|uniref:CPBP family intramembrane glutamic endopeptidase n=1 Tax=Companilactobacillus jidongensis TaxID=2486006 RepID=UPI000F778876|nr:type II CAAX endopeptidase family protein [Companilactobacillus jidongensis]